MCAPRVGGSDQLPPHGADFVGEPSRVLQIVASYGQMMDRSKGRWVGELEGEELIESIATCEAGARRGAALWASVGRVD
jgi:hypothetical protein